MYSVAGYGAMIADRVRISAYSEAMRRAITPGCTVLDIGTGTGFFAMLACRLGARKVYAVEPDDVIQLAREAALANGFADRIEFIQDLSTRIDLPEQVDVVVSDLRTVLPWFEQHVATIVDARTRLLKPGGVLIPAGDRLSAAVVELPEIYAQRIGHQPDDTAGFDMSAARRFAANAWSKARATPEQFVTEPVEWATLDYKKVTDPNVAARLDWTAIQPAIAHGMLAWFDAVLIDDIGFSNNPSAPQALYGQAFFPWAEPVSIERGDSISIALAANLVGDDYVWSWKSRVQSGADGPVKAQFSQSSFRAPPLKRLRQCAPDHVPLLSGRERLDAFIVEQMNGKSALREIAEAVASHFPAEFPTFEQAFGAVVELSLRYSR